jgi:hypothetical protein
VYNSLIIIGLFGNKIIILPLLPTLTLPIKKHKSFIQNNNIINIKDIKGSEEEDKEEDEKRTFGEFMGASLL